MKPERNDPCPCGSGKKYKKCCMEKTGFNPPAPKQSGKGAAPTTAECSQLIALFNAGRLAELENLARLLLERCPDSGFVWKILGVTLQRQGKDSLHALQKATELLPNDAEAHCHLGITLYEMGRLDEAEASCRRTLQLNPDWAFAHYNLGVALDDLGRLDEAAASYRRALQIQPDYAEAHNNLGFVYHKIGKLNEAEASFRRALRFSPDLDKALHNLGFTLHELDRFDEAEASYRRALALNPDNAKLYCNLGLTFLAQRKPDEALECYQQQAKLAPENSAAHHMIAALSGKNTERAPEEYVKNLFDDYAKKFDTHLQQTLQYDVPRKLVALITQHATPPGGKWDVLDLGCGTGLVGSAIAPFARQLVGVDLSAKMLEKARARGLYQRLERMDLLTMMRGEKASGYDVIIAADVFIYIGKIDEIIGEARRLLRPGGVFAFSIETLVASPDEASLGAQREYRLEKTGRYSQSVSYISRLASTNGFLPQEMVATQIRLEHGKPIDGYLVLWKA